MTDTTAPPPGEWLETGSHTTCPKCGSLAIQVRLAYRAKPIGSFSLAGAQVKFSATRGWEYRCPDCGATGPAEPKEGTEPP